MQGLSIDQRNSADSAPPIPLPIAAMAPPTAAAAAAMALPIAARAWPTARATAARALPIGVNVEAVQTPLSIFCLDNH